MTKRDAQAPPSVPDGVPQLLSTGEVGKLLRRPERYARYKVECGVWPYIWDGGRRKVRAADLAAWAALVGIPLDWEAVIC